MLPTDCWFEILTKVDNGTDYKNWLLVCRMFWEIYQPYHQYYVDRFNYLAKLEAIFSDKPWNWEVTSQYPSITWDTIQEDPYIPWDWGRISRDINITRDTIANNPTRPWVWGSNR